MAEYFEGGSNKHEKFNNKLKEINKHYDSKVKKNSIFTSQRQIEIDRSNAIKELKNEYYGSRSGGSFAPE